MYKLRIVASLVEIMLGLVSSQMLQTPNVPLQPLGQNSQTLFGLPPLPHNKVQLGLQPYAQDNRVSAGVPNQYSALEKFSTQAQIQHPQLIQNQVLQLSQSGVLGGQQIPLPASPLNQQMPQHLSQNVGRSQIVTINPQFSAAGFQNTCGLAEGAAGTTTNQTDRALKMAKLNNGRATPSQAVPLPSSDIQGRQPMRTEETPDTRKQVTQMQLPLDVDSTLLQQVMNLRPDQLLLLPPDQQHQVIQLQRMLRQAT